MQFRQATWPLTRRGGAGVGTMQLRHLPNLLGIFVPFIRSLVTFWGLVI